MLKWLRKKAKSKSAAPLCAACCQNPAQLVAENALVSIYTACKACADRGIIAPLTISKA